jgi:hypothetical protein
VRTTGRLWRATGRRPAATFACGSLNFVEGLRCITEPSWPTLWTECIATRVLLTPSVLLVNDVLDERDMYTRTLRAVGHRVITAEDSAVAYRIATKRTIDIVVTDVCGWNRDANNGVAVSRRERGPYGRSGYGSRKASSPARCSSSRSGDFSRGHARPADTRSTCSWCSGTMVHRDRWPMLASDGW